MRKIVTTSAGLSPHLQYFGFRALDRVARGHPSFRSIARMARATRKLFPAGNAVQIDRPCRMWIPLGDPLWTRMLFASFDWEPEIQTVLDLVQGPDTDVVDLGANIGFWSCYLAERGARRIVAVEPSSQSYPWLARNAGLHAERIALVKQAVAERSGETVQISKRVSHGGNYVLGTRAEGTPDRHALGSEPVETCTVDALVAAHGLDGDRLILKLDIEGSEIAALSGARRTLAERDALLIYEDHGKDADSRISAFVLDDLGYRVFAVDDGRVVRLPDTASVTRYKQSRGSQYGYDLFAAKPGGRMAAALDASAA